MGERRKLRCKLFLQGDNKLASATCELSHTIVNKPSVSQREWVLSVDIHLQCAVMLTIVM